MPDLGRWPSLDSATWKPAQQRRLPCARDRRGRAPRPGALVAAVRVRPAASDHRVLVKQLVESRGKKKRFGWTALRPRTGITGGSSCPRPATRARWRHMARPTRPPREAGGRRRAAPRRRGRRGRAVGRVRALLGSKPIPSPPAAASRGAASSACATATSLPAARRGFFDAARAGLTPAGAPGTRLSEWSGSPRRARVTRISPEAAIGDRESAVAGFRSSPLAIWSQPRGAQRC